MEWLPLHHYSLFIINYSLSTMKTKRGNSLAIHGCTELSDFGVKPEARKNERDNASLVGRGKGGAYEK
jgi:hypothetical protein